MLDQLTREDFEPLLGQSLKLEAANGATQAEVAETRAIANPSPRAAPFALVLRVREPWGGQGLYRLSHPTRGAIDLFLVPVGPDGKGGTCYEAVFN
jgi:hypothetical protein